MGKGLVITKLNMNQGQNAFLKFNGHVFKYH